MTPAIVLVFVAYLLLPTEMLSAWAIDQRIVVGLFLLLVASAAPRFPNRRMALLIGAAALMIVLARLGIVEAFWLKADRVYAADLSGIETLPLGAKLAVAYPESALAANAIPEVHLPALATMRRGAFVPTVFAFTGQQPIALKPPYDRLAAAADPYDLWAAFMTGDDAARTRAASVLAEYDAIVFVDRQPFQVPNEHCLLPLFVRPTFRIFTLLHDEGCPAHR